MEPFLWILAASLATFLVVVFALTFRAPAPRLERPEVNLTNEAFVRWLAACRPPMSLFLSMTPDEQEKLAELGRAHLRDLCVAIGYAVQNPVAADAGMSPDSVDHEVDALQQLAERVATKMTGQQPKPAAPQRTMGGLGARRNGNGKVHP